MFQTDISSQPILFLNSYRDLVNEDSDVFLFEDIFSQIDLEDWDYAYGIEGHAKPPVLMLRTIFYGMTHGLVSGRKLEEACRNDIRYIFLSGGLRPDRRTFDRFLDRHEERFNQLFVTIVRMAEKMGLVKLGRVAFDGTRIKGYTSKSGLEFVSMNKTVEKLEAQLITLREAIKRENAVDVKTDDRLEEELKDKELRLKKIKRAKAQLEKEHKENPTRMTKKDGTPPNTASKSLNDPEALSLSHKSKDFMFGYNVQLAVDEAHQIVVATDLHDSATEYEAFPKLLSQVHNNFKRVPDQILADTGYYSEDNIAIASEQGSSPYIAPCSERKLKEHRAFKDKSLLFEQIRENPSGRIVCLSGRVLGENNRRKGKIELIVNSEKFCIACQFSKECVIKDKNYFQVPMEIGARRAVHNHRKREGTLEFQQIYSRRKVIVEPVFGNIKWNKKLSLCHIGRNRAYRQTRMWCTAHNVEKIVKAIIKTKIR